MLRGGGRRALAALLLPPRRRAASKGGGGVGGSSAGAQGPARLEPWLLRFLVCPLSKRPLRYEETSNELVNEELGIAYPVVDGIPTMIPEAARKTRAEPPAAAAAEGAERP
ncbi:protein preY, mitochondrial [Struthio camelus]|uniref:protein preY, mitochondrial n=1 Tax=Struthio camelus TaxID=8801 RepID=UPI003603E481